MKFIKKIPYLAVLLSTGIFYLFSSTATAQCDQNTVGGGVNCASNGQLTNLTGSDGIVTNVINGLFMAAGIIAVLFIVIGGIRYVVSQGDEKSVQGAKNTVLYAVIGLLIVLLAFAIVNFVLDLF